MPFAKRIPNILSATRLALVPGLWAIALIDWQPALGIGLLMAGATDALDGFLARKMDAVSATGAALDSLADNLLVLSMAAWLLLLRPDVVATFGLWLGACVFLHLAFLVVAFIRFRRFGNLHLYSSKVAAVIGFAFVATCFLRTDVPVILGVLAFSAATLTVVECLVCALVCDRVDERIGSVLRVLRSPGAYRKQGDREGGVRGPA